MSQNSALMVLLLWVYAVGLHASPNPAKNATPKQSKAIQNPLKNFLIPHEPVPLTGEWSLVKKREDLTDNGCFITIRPDHTLTILTGGLEADPPYTVVWTQEGNRIHFICPVANQNDYTVTSGLDAEHMKAWLTIRGQWVRQGFGYGLSILEYRGQILLVPEGNLAKVNPLEYPHADYPVGWSFTRSKVTDWGSLFPDRKQRP